MKKSSKSRKLKVALVYDRINKWGGAERILLLLHEMFPDAPIFTSVYNKKTAPWARKLNIKTSFLQNIPLARRHHEFFAPFMPLAFEGFNFDPYDMVISLTSEAAKGIKTKKNTSHICICLTPTRYLWSEYETYFPNENIQTLLEPLIFLLRKWDKKAAKRPDKMIAISKNVQSRIKKYYKRDSEVLYPPLLLKGSTVVKSDKLSYFLVVSRLSKFSPHKNIELAIRACNMLNLPLKVVGDGDINHFKKIAGKTVEIVGKVNDEKLSGYYKNCMALIFPGVEDFGLVMVEAQSFGKPVIAYKRGGALEIIKNGKTGMFFERQTVTSLVNTLKLFDKGGYNMKDCIANSKRFTKKEFVKRLKSIISEELHT